MRRRLFALAPLLAACSSAPATKPAPPHIDAPPIAIAAPTASASAAPADVPIKLAEIQEMLARVSAIRGLPIKHAVNGAIVTREQALVKIKKQVADEMPESAIEYEGEALTALGLVPPEYDFVEGSYRLLEGRIAGFYDPHDKAMYLVDDLGDDDAKETLAHELVHALQDQSFDLAPLVKYVPGDGDRISAIQALVEGDATSAMLDVDMGSAFQISDKALRVALILSTGLSSVGATTPHVMQESLIAPYADGFAFVQNRRTKGGFAMVDAAFRRLPDSTEQILHPEKYDAREMPIAIKAPPIDALGAGWKAALDDVMGEQGLRIVLSEWGGTHAGTDGAAGWGGDRYVVARKDEGKDHAIALGWLLRFDTEKDASEMAAILKSKFGAACLERKDVGPFAWRSKKRDVAVAAGPYVRASKTTATSAGACAAADAWAEKILATAP